MFRLLLLTHDFLKVELLTKGILFINKAKDIHIQLSNNLYLHSLPEKAC